MLLGGVPLFDLSVPALVGFVRVIGLAITELRELVSEVRHVLDGHW
jgi:hypothetical protein